MAARPDTHPAPTAPAPARTARPPLPTYPGPSHPERLPNPEPADTESPGEQAARDSWLDATSLRQAKRAENTVDALTVVIDSTIDMALRRRLVIERTAWRSMLDGVRSRPYRVLAVVGCGPVTLLLRQTPAGDYQVAERREGVTKVLHSGYRDRSQAQTALDAARTSTR